MMERSRMIGMAVTRLQTGMIERNKELSGTVYCIWVLYTKLNVIVR